MPEPPTVTASLPSAGGVPVAPPTGWALVAGGLRAACMLLTRLPVGRRPIPAEARRWGAAFFPLVGLGLGLLGSALLIALEPRLGARLAAAIAIAALLLVTGALHEDGLADTADALGGAQDRDRLFAILKDSRLGTYGVLALCLSMFVRIEALHQLGGQGPSVYALAAALSRAPMTWLMGALPYVTPENLARSADLAGISRKAVLVATMLSLSIAATAVAARALSWWAAGLALLTSAGIAVLAGWRFHRRAGGITGDFLGATQQLAEIAILLSLLAAR